MKKYIEHRNFNSWNLILLVYLAAILLCQGCRKFVEIDPPATQLVSASVYGSDASASAAVTSIYANMSNRGLSDGIQSFTILFGLYADELTKYSTDATWSASYSNSPRGLSPGYFEMYQRLYVINSAIEGITASNTLSPPVKKQLLGETKFMRGFFYFYLTNIYGDVPLMLTSDYTINKSASRTSKDKIYDQIILDLGEAENSLPSNYVTGVGVATTERIRPNKGAASALLARVFLYKGDWANANQSASRVIDQKDLYEIVPVNLTFKKNNRESIFQLQSTVVGIPNTATAQYLIFRQGYTPLGNSTLAAISPQLKKALVENGGNRLTAWVGKYSENGNEYLYPFKYQAYLNPSSSTEYMTVLRLAEQYLIRAEARVHLGDFDGAKKDLLEVRSRAGLNGIDSSDPATLYAAIADERQVELFAEWGDRWFDLARRGKASEVMKIVTPTKGGTWEEYKLLFPLPQGEIDLNTNLKPNNPGYEN